jgi:glycosyltransferase involved in cell wall biosynthesis
MAPSVTIVTATRDRRKFLPHLIATIEKQTFPKDELEWLVLDDGDDGVGELIERVPYARYIQSAEKILLGHKRNIGNDLARGEFIFYFDDDNYAFPHRVAVGVKALQENPDAMMIGSSDMFIYDSSLRAAYVCGPFGERHATLGTWGLRRSLLSTARFDANLKRGEEVSFTKNWSVPIIQVGRSNTSVCFDHGNNTVSKQHLIRQASKFLPLRDIIKDQDSRDFFESF